MGPYDLGRRRTRERPLLRSCWRKGPQPRGIRDAKARAERSVGQACLRRRTGSGTPQGSTGSDGSAGPRVLGRAQSSAAHGRIRGLPSSTRGRSRMDERPCPDLRGGCAVMRIPTVTGGEGLGNDPSYPVRVRLSALERRELQAIVDGTGVAWRRRRAQILLMADEGRDGGKLRDVDLARGLGIGASTVERLRKRCVLEGLEAALRRREPENRRPKLRDGAKEAKRVALAGFPRPRVVSAGRGSCAPAVGWRGRSSRASRRNRYGGFGKTGDPALAEAVRVPSPEPQRAVRGGEGGGAGPGSAGGCRRRGSGLQG